MSQENVEIVKRFRKAWLAGDFEKAFEFLHPAIEWDARHFPDGRIYHGHEGVREFIVEPPRAARSRLPESSP